MLSPVYIVKCLDNVFTVYDQTDEVKMTRHSELEGVEAAVRALRNLGYSGEHILERQADNSIKVWLKNIHGQKV